MRKTRPFAVVIGVAILLTQVLLPDHSFAVTSLNGHVVVTDNAGKIIPWTSDPAAGYGTVVDKAWNYLLTGVPDDPSTGKPAYFSQSYINPDTQGMAGWPHNPAGLYSMLVESALKYYAYSGDVRPVNLAKQVASWQIANGMTKSTDNWAGVPYSSGDAGSLNYHGAAYGDSTGVGDGTGYLQPDKVGAMGHAWAQLYAFDGDTSYRDAAIAAADALVRHIRTGNATQSPWPFRVNAATGAIREQYTANVIDPIQLFDALIELGIGDTAGYRAARQTAWNWLMAYPMVNNSWANYFEDVAVQSDLGNDNQLIPMMTARYLLTHQDADPNWRSHVQALITWVEANFSTQDSGATIIKEQNAFPYTMGSHTSRFASINALYSAATGDADSKTKAFYSLNWATYMTRDNGVVIDGPQVNNQWFTDGYGDYIRHFLTSMQAFPEWAPSGQSHLTGSTSLIRTVSYSGTAISYSTADPASTESFRLSFRPSRVTVGGRTIEQRADLTQEGWTYDAVTQVLRVRHDSGGAVQVSAGDDAGGDPANQAPSVAMTAPAGGSTVQMGASVQLNATATDADGSVATVEFFNGSQQLARIGQSPYTHAWSPNSAGTYSLSAVASDDDGATARSAVVTITVSAAGTPNPGSWSSQDIGTVGVAGASSIKDGKHTVSGSGVDIWDAADSFRYVYQPLVGDGQITARVDSQDASDPWALSGVMIREDLSAESRHVLLATTPGNGLSLTSRSQPGGMSEYSSAGSGIVPHWLRLVRAGDVFTALGSVDGREWTTLGLLTLPMGSTVHAGLAVTSHNNSELSTGTYSNVNVAGSTDTTPPLISGVAVGNANQNGASVTWSTSEPANSQIEYGKSATYGMSTALNTSLVTRHSMVVSGLDPDTTYHFRVRSTDAAGNLATGADGVFTTPGAVLTTGASPTSTVPTPTATRTSTPTTSSRSTTPPSMTTRPAPPSDDVSMRARVNSEYVAADRAGAAPLIANRPAIGPWETFDLINLGGGKVALKAHANKRYVCADNAGASSLIANRTAIGAWETFILVRNSDGTKSLKARANGKFVTAESAGAAALIADRTTIGPWEKFDLIAH